MIYTVQGDHLTVQRAGEGYVPVTPELRAAVEMDMAHQAAKRGAA